MNLLILILGICSATLFWPLNRWAARNGGRAGFYAFWLLLLSAILAAVLAMVFGQRLWDRTVWQFALIIGLCYAGSLQLMLFCMANGPAGPVTAANNMGLVWPVVASFVFLNPRWPSLSMIVGILAVCGALILLAISQRFARNGVVNDSAGGPNRRRILEIALPLLWIVAGLSMTFQATAAQRLPESPLALISVMSAVAWVAVLPWCLRMGRPILRRNEAIPGAIAGLVQVSTGFAILVGVARMEAHIVFPFIVATPIIIMLLAGHFIFKENLGPLGWAGCLLGTFGLILLVVNGN